MRTLILTATILAPAAASAGGYVLPNETSRELALSQAAVADQNGAEAVFLNPAALAGQEGFNFSLNGEFLINRSDWSDPTLGSSNMPAQLNIPPAIAVSYGARLENGMPWGVGVGTYVPCGGSIDWPDNWPGQESIKTVQQQIFAIGGGAALQPLPFLKLGATYVRYQGTEELHQALNFLGGRIGEASLSTAGGANGFGVAAEVRVPDVPLRFAVNYSHKAELDMEGDAHFIGVPPSFQVLLHDQEVSSKRIVPAQLYVGAAYEVMPDIKVMAAYNLERWSVYEDDTFVGADGFSVTVPRDYNNAHVFRAASEWQHMPFLPALTGRLGVLRSISDQPSETVSPSLTDGNSWAFSIGGGLDVTPGLRLDLAWQHALFDDVTASGPEAFPGTYDTTVDLISIGVNWRFGGDAGRSGGGAPAVARR